ncbi:MAG TPA: RluA family pseudouridine synthase [Bryobacteraceae bacterium]|nr:RluA family pseudouridine synthase [Bryobacteraceae bacterium]
MFDFTADNGKRLDRFLQDRLPQYSRSRIQEWIKAGRVLVDGAARKASYMLRGGESVSVAPAHPPPLAAAPEDLPIDVLYEDADVVAIDKPAGLIVHAGAGAHSGTLVNRLVHRFGELSTIGGEVRPGIVHRLDKDTSGVLLVARTDAAHRSLAAQFAARTVEKTYLAVVHGVIKDDSGRITAPIARDPVHRTRMTVRLGTGRRALTQYRVLRRFQRFTFVEVRIGTGRTHQIRVHMASLGHPVAGDRLYGAPSKVEGRPSPGRFLLHAWRIRFESPSTGEPITVEAPIPEEFDRWMDGL